MNELISLGNFSPEKLSQHLFRDVTKYLEVLAQKHKCHLFFQCNDTINNTTNCRKKYIAQYLFLKIVCDFLKTQQHDLFHLFCDDFHPSNIIVNADLNVCDIID